jgi:hypothetical protein
MSNHNFFTQSPNGTVEPGTSEPSLGPSHQVLAHQPRNESTLSSPTSVRGVMTVVGRLIRFHRHVLELCDGKTNAQRGSTSLYKPINLG